MKKLGIDAYRVFQWHNGTQTLICSADVSLDPVSLDVHVEEEESGAPTGHGCFFMDPKPLLDSKAREYYYINTTITQ